MVLKEISKTARIIKYRFSEVVLIIALVTMAQVSVSRLQAENPDNFTDMLPLVLFGVGAAIISAILGYGFLRTICYEPFHKHQPADLIKIGKSFFWRMAGYAIFTGALGMLLFLPILLIANGLFGGGESGMPEYIFPLAVFLVALILIKPIVFIPAFIISRNAGLWESFKSLQEFNLKLAKPVIVLFVVQIMLASLLAVLPVSREADITVYYSVTVAFTVIGQLFRLMVSVGAIRFVSSLDGRSLDGGGSEENQEESGNQISSDTKDF
jgi:hypothetical protein